MAPDPSSHARDSGQPSSLFGRVLGWMSVFTMLITLPQVLTIWRGHQAAGVSVLSWSAYLLSAILWFWYVLSKRDRNIYLPCIGWAALDSAVIVGALIYG